MKEATFAQAFSRMFTGGRHLVKRLNPSYVFFKLRVVGAVTFCRTVLPWNILKNSRSCSCKKLKISAGIV